MKVFWGEEYSSVYVWLIYLGPETETCGNFRNLRHWKAQTVSDVWEISLIL